MKTAAKIVLAIIACAVVGFGMHNLRGTFLVLQHAALENEIQRINDEYYAYKQEFSRVQKQNQNLWLELNRMKERRSKHVSVGNAQKSESGKRQRADSTKKKG